MYPVLFRFGNFEITTFVLMMFLAFIIGGWVMTRQFRRSGLNEELASSVLMAAAVGGIVGAKIYYAILFHDWHLLFDRAGLVWYGGFIGGLLAVWIVLWRKRVDYFIAVDGMAPAAAIGYALGRIGCFLVGDDYGRPTNSWVGIAFPNGRHDGGAFDEFIACRCEYAALRFRADPVSRSSDTLQSDCNRSR